MNNTNNHDGLFDDCATAIIYSVITVIDTGKKKRQTCKSLFCIESAIYRRKKEMMTMMNNTNNQQ